MLGREIIPGLKQRSIRGRMVSGKKKPSAHDENSMHLAKRRPPVAHVVKDERADYSVERLVVERKPVREIRYLEIEDSGARVLLFEPRARMVHHCRARVDSRDPRAALEKLFRVPS